MKFRPLHDRVVVKRIDAEDKTAGGSSFRTVPRKSPRRAKSSPWARVAATKLAN
jgi:chaperonin GroES